MSEDDKQQTEQPAVAQAPDAEGAEAPAEEQAVDPRQTELRDRFGEAVVGFDDVKGYCAPVVAADSLPEVCGALREESGYNFLRCISGIDRGDGLEVAYNLLNMETKDELVLKVKLPDSKPRVPSLTALWPTADWLERETYDLFGIVFEGHPDLRRILLPDDWEGHPLRKDYEYRRD